MTLCRTVHNKNYTVINNTISTDSRLSWKAKGIWMYAFSRPNDWEFYVADIIKQSTDGARSVYAGLKELEKMGYLERRQLQKQKGGFGTMEYIFYEIPQKSFTNVQNAHAQNAHTQNAPLLSTDCTNHSSKEEFTEKKKKPRNCVAPSEQAFGLCDFLFEKIKENHEKAKRSNREAWAQEIDRMMRIDGYSPEQVRELAEFSQKDPFWRMNVLSATKLRAHAHKLVLKLKTQSSKTPQEEKGERIRDNIEWAHKFVKQTFSGPTLGKIRVWDTWCEVKVDGRWCHIAATEFGFKEQVQNALRKAGHI